MTDIRMDVVDLLLDCDNFSAEAYLAKELRHSDGTPFTEEEHAKIGSANRAEIQAMADFSATAADYYAGRSGDLKQLGDLTEPYAAQLGDNPTIEQIRAVMTPEHRADLDALLDRLAPDGYFVSTEPLADESEPLGSPFEELPSDHVLIPLEEVAQELAGMTPCPSCQGTLGLHVEPASTDSPDGEWHVVRVHTLPCPEVQS